MAEETALSEAVSALKVIRKCLRCDTGAVGEYRSARQWLRDHDRYEGNLQELAVPLEVAEVALRIIEARAGAGPSAGTPERLTCDECEGPMVVKFMCGHCGWERCEANAPCVAGADTPTRCPDCGNCPSCHNPVESRAMSYRPCENKFHDAVDSVLPATPTKEDE